MVKFLLDNGMCFKYTVILHAKFLSLTGSARHVSIISGKPEAHGHPIISQWLKLQKYNPPDFKLFLGTLNNKHFLHMVQCDFLELFSIVYCSENRLKIDICGVRSESTLFAIGNFYKNEMKNNKCTQDILKLLWTHNSQKYP